MFKKYLFIVFVLITAFGCKFKGGNRQPDLNIPIYSNVNIFYLRNYSIYLDSDWKRTNPLNSELINYPEQFFTIMDTQNNMKYSFEHIVFETDSLFSRNHKLFLNSVYDFSKKRWITDRREFSIEERNAFLNFMTKKIIPRIIEKNKKVNDTILYNADPGKVIFNFIKQN